LSERTAGGRLLQESRQSHNVPSTPDVGGKTSTKREGEKSKEGLGDERHRFYTTIAPRRDTDHLKSQGIRQRSGPGSEPHFPSRRPEKCGRIRYTGRKGNFPLRERPGASAHRRTSRCHTTMALARMNLQDRCRSPAGGAGSCHQFLSKQAPLHSFPRVLPDAVRYTTHCFIVVYSTCQRL
jgi:hypothetical protein